jgi:hypothetical protein
MFPKASPEVGKPAADVSTQSTMFKTWGLGMEMEQQR